METAYRKRYRIKSKFRFITFIVITVGLLIGIIGAVSGLNDSRAMTAVEYKEIEICSGDTLWDIANTYKSDSTDTRKAVYRICRINDIQASDLVPGMILSIPEDF